MARHDRILISPSRARLIEELHVAVGCANAEVPVLAALEYDEWMSIVCQMSETPEGRQQWSDSRYGDTARVAVTWWTDQRCERHFRIVAGNSRDGRTPQESAINSAAASALVRHTRDRMS